MNEKSLEVLEQFEFNIYRINRGRGGMLINTNDGIKLFLECQKSDHYYEREDTITQLLMKYGIEHTDTYMRNRRGELFTNDAEGRRYVVKNWYDGKECNVSDKEDVRLAVTSLAQLHTALGRVSQDYRSYISFTDNVKNINDVYKRHTRELKMAFNYLKNKNNKSEFEQLAYKNILSFYEEAKESLQLLEEKQMQTRIARVYDNAEISHGSFNYHNIIMLKDECAITNFNRYKNECQISDLYQFMRKILEKCDWNIDTAYHIIDDYDKIKTISDDDMKLLSAMFAFPEKFWKIINFYLNSNKAWIPPKNLEKLKKVVGQNDKRKQFVKILSNT